jgi:methanethiol S-methyltransferase
MGRFLSFLYGALAYVLFLGVFLYAVGFLGNFAVPVSIDMARTGPMAEAVLVNLLLLGLFAVQHSLMARPWFKRWITRIVPRPIERSTYVLASNVAMILLFWQWRPMGGVLWDVSGTGLGMALQASFAFGWLLVLVSTFLINHFDLFGLRQVWMHLRGREYEPLSFTTPGPYRLVRHPLYFGWITVFWSAPTMTIAHLLFAVATTAYILVAIRFEERDLVREHGKRYDDYRRSVPMLIPRPAKNGATRPAGAEA